ncbi:fungal-specific transcription factor domain-domain-containing protein [Lobosporangium transversale]|uniref:Fungal-specific transcription factor domain-domain-containing protein n=1 Tax=Lobosporangium transversale TaxID=64571 RepID=A0A1Y2H255_9FUNG|nr:fungal-specific transcription factor domain-domain-containing protein [Lobosporangium transversale]ORZ27793.1 fungal-specific transcription factor domain-domain-containing protein [Lobosporangium transversale]|eukprot:XP_021885496.1 fungal-specific transcription factor domain-domain-containing protein [Lobosporangium transversale]
MTGYIEAIEARLHRMEGLLGGLVKDKDPRAEIVRAELDAMAREAEMTGLKLRRSKAYEEINHRPQNAPQPQRLPAHSSHGVNSNYHNQHQPHFSPQPPQHQQHQHRQSQQKSSHSPYSSNYSEARPTGSNQSLGYTDSRMSQNHLRPGSHVTQSHHSSHTLHESDRQRTLTTNGGSNSSFNMSHRHSFSNGSSHSSQEMDSHRLVTHRPSLTTHPLSNPLTGYMHIPETNSKDVALIMPSIDVIDHLLEVHFRSIHPVLPMLHARTILDQIRQSESPPSHLLFAILGLASRFSDNTAFRTPQHGVERPPCTIFYERAKFFMKDEYDNSQIATIQTLLLMAIQQMGFCESQRAWLYVGMAIRMAQDLGLNKEPSEQEYNRNRLQCELRKRTWWSLYVVDRLICAGLGRPLTIMHKDCETGFPQNEDEEVDFTTGRTVLSRPATIANFIHLLTLSKIQGDILEFIKAKHCTPLKSNKSSSKNSAFIQNFENGFDQDRESCVDTSDAVFSALDKALTEWRQNLPESLQIPTAYSPRYGLFLHLTFNTLVILLHRPEMSTSPTSASLCVQAAATISDITEILMDTEALTSMFISCLYAIFSAGIVHFMNIPSVRKPSKSSFPSPVLSASNETLSNHTINAKTNLKRCIDALKFLANHWVSAARRAKVLEDLLDLKHVSLKDLEVDTFKMSPVGPSWVLESQYKDALVGPRECQDKLRQQCRSKVMAIQSLLVNDDEFNKMQHRRSISFPDHNMDIELEHIEESSQVQVQEPVNKGDDNVEQGFRVQEDAAMNQSKSSASSSPAMSNRPPPSMVGLGAQSPVQTEPSVSSPSPGRTDTTITQTLESDSELVHSTISPNMFESSTGDNNSSSKRVKAQESGLLTPITVRALAHGTTSPQLDDARRKSEATSPLANEKNTSSTIVPSLASGSQGAMLDPFSMPSSISFPDWSNDRRPSSADVNRSSGAQPSSQFNTVWTTDSLTQRTTARSAASSPMISSSGIMGSDNKKTAAPNHTPNTSINISAQPLPLNSEPNTYALSVSKASEQREDQDLVWHDMPPTLGLDEWTAYIGALMMRWLYASGQSSPRSNVS